MKLKQNTIGILEVSYPIDIAFDRRATDAATIEKQGPNIKLKLSAEVDYDQVYQYFSQAGILAEEHVQDASNPSTPQAAYYRDQRVFYFVERENIVTAIKVLQNLDLIPDDESGTNLLDYYKRMTVDENYQHDKQMLQLLRWQNNEGYLALSLDKLKAVLLERLSETLSKLLENSHYQTDEMQQRQDYIKQVIELSEAKSSYKKLIACINRGITQFNKDKDDLSYVLMRAGENFIQQWHNDNAEVYRSDIYLNIIFAQRVLLTEKIGNGVFLANGDNLLAFTLYTKAVATVNDEYLGPPEAYYQLGFMYKHNLVPHDDVKDRNKMAIYYFKRAAERDYKPALLQLGKMHVIGKGIDSADVKTAISYFKRVIGMSTDIKTEEFESVLRLVQYGKKPAIDYLQEKLELHKKKLLRNLHQLLNMLATEKLETFYNSVLSLPYELTSDLKERGYVAVGIRDLQYLHFLADSINVLKPGIYDGFVFAKRTLLSFYSECVKHSKQEKSKIYFYKIALDYQKKIAQQIEAENYNERLKAKSPSRLLVKVVVDDNLNEFIALLNRENMDVNIRLIDGKMPLICFAAENGSLKITHYLLAQNVDLKAGAVNGYNALVSVCKRNGNEAELCTINKLKIAELLLKRGVDVNIFEGENHTPLHMATLSCFDEMILLLLGHGAHIDAHDSIKRTPLAGLIRDFMEQPPLSPAIVKRQLSAQLTIELLLMAGANISAFEVDDSGPGPGTDASESIQVRTLLNDYQLSRVAKESNKSLEQKPSIDEIRVYYAGIMYAKAYASYQKQKLDEALADFNSAYRSFTEVTSKKITCCEFLATIHLNRGNYSLAQKYAREAIDDISDVVRTDEQSLPKKEALEELHSKSSILVKAHEFASKGLALFQEEKYQDAESNFLLAIEEHKKIYKQSAKLAVYFYNLGSCYDKQSNLDKAIEFTHKSLIMDQKLLGYNAPQTNKARNKLKDLRGKLKQATTNNQQETEKPRSTLKR